MQSVSLHPRLLITYSLKSEGDLDKRFSTPDIYKSNRKLLLKSLGIAPHQLIEGEQVHSNRILRLDGENTKMWCGQKITGVDGFVTDQTDVYLLLRVADCLPVVIYDPVHHVLALIHAGWRGTLKDIHLVGLNRLIQVYQTNPKACLVWFGPSARNCCFSTPDEPQQYHDSIWSSYISKRSDRYFIDLLGYQIDTLKAAGVLKKNMLVDPHCTVSDPTFFSHLRSQANQEAEGRFAVIAKLKP